MSHFEIIGERKFSLKEIIMITGNMIHVYDLIPVGMWDFRITLHDLWKYSINYYYCQKIPIDYSFIFNRLARRKVYSSSMSKLYPYVDFFSDCHFKEIQMPCFRS